MVRIQKLTAIILLIVLSACSQRVAFSFEVLTPAPTGSSVLGPGTPMAFVTSPTPWVAGTQTALAVTEFPTAPPPLPTFSFSAPHNPAEFSPILYGGNLYGRTFFLLLGGVGQNTWITPAESVARFNGEMTYSLHTMTLASKYFVWGKAPQFSPNCNNYFIDSDASLYESGLTAVMDGWNTTKREVIELSDDDAFYQQAVDNWLKSYGMASPQSGTLQVLRTDLEGDGVNEIFISATHLDESQHMTNPGDYSVVLMRRVVGSEVVTISLVADIYSEDNSGVTFPQTYSLANFIDLNQDGTLEVVVDIQKWEGFGAMVIQVNGQGTLQALTAVC